MNANDNTAVELKMVLVFRADLPQMLRGKSEIQAAHGAVKLAHRLTKSDEQLMDEYLAQNQPKVNVEVNDLEGIHKIIRKAENRGIHYELVQDAGNTVFEGPTYTCAIFGPTSSTNSNALTRDTRMR